jgi:hypothetical protein
MEDSLERCLLSIWLEAKEVLILATQASKLDLMELRLTRACSLSKNASEHWIRTKSIPPSEEAN